MALRERCPGDSYSHVDVSALQATHWVPHSHCRVRQSFWHAPPRKLLLGHQSEPGPDALPAILRESRVWQRFSVSVCVGPEVEGAVVRQCLGADRIAECVRREPNGTKCAPDSWPAQWDPYPTVYAGLVAESASAPCIGRELSPAIEQLGSPASPSQRRIESLGDSTSGLRKRVPAQSISAAVAIGRGGYISAPAGNRLQSAESFIVQFADVARYGYEFRELLS